LARLREKYGLTLEQNFRLGQYDTLGKIVDYVAARRSGGAPTASEDLHVPAPAMFSAAPALAAPALAPAPSTGGRSDLFREIAALYASALEYPQDVFTETAGLESELGVDSVKQTELLARLREKYGLTLEQNFRLGQYDTLGKIVDYVAARRGGVAVPS
jgi:acyl carrier protein